MSKHTRFKRYLAAVMVSTAIASASALAGYAGLVFTPDPANFGTVPIGTGITLNITASSSSMPAGNSNAPAGAQPFTVNSVTLPAGFQINGGTCPTSGNGSLPCTFAVRFSPTAVGTQSGTVIVNASVSGFTQNSSFAVTGTGSPVTQLPVNGTVGLFTLLGSLALVGLWMVRRH